jgi:hypothetical protein
VRPFNNLRLEAFGEESSPSEDEDIDFETKSRSPELSREETIINENGSALY